jgi:IS1 family transposase
MECEPILTYRDLLDSSPNREERFRESLKCRNRHEFHRLNRDQKCLEKNITSTTEYSLKRYANDL